MRSAACRLPATPLRRGGGRGAALALAGRGQIPDGGRGWGTGGGVEPSRRHLALAALQPGGGVSSPLPSPPLSPHEKSLTTTPPPPPLYRRSLLSGSILAAMMVREAGGRRRKRSFVGPFQGRRISWRLERAKAKVETFGVGLNRCCRAGTFFPILKRMAGLRGGGGGDTRYSVETQEGFKITTFFCKKIFFVIHRKRL